MRDPAVKRQGLHGAKAFVTVGHRYTAFRGEMAESGFLFYLSDNRVWLVDSVPAQYLKLQN